MGCDCALALRGSGARVFVCRYADMGHDCAFAFRGSGARLCADTPIWARIAFSLSLVCCSCSFLSWWRRDSSLGLPIQLTIEIVQLQTIDKVFDVSVVQDQQVLRVLTWRRRSSLHSCSSLKLPGRFH